MKNFVVIYYSTEEDMKAFRNLSPKEMENATKAWDLWQEKFNGNIVDLGAPLMPGVALDKIAQQKDPNKIISGYSIVQAKDIEEAKLLFWDHPHQNCGIHIFETINK